MTSQMAVLAMAGIATNGGAGPVAGIGINGVTSRMWVCLKRSSCQRSYPAFQWAAVFCLESWLRRMPDRARMRAKRHRPKLRGDLLSKENNKKMPTCRRPFRIDRRERNKNTPVGSLLFSWAVRVTRIGSGSRWGRP